MSPLLRRGMQLRLAFGDAGVPSFGGLCKDPQA